VTTFLHACRLLAAISHTLLIVAALLATAKPAASVEECRTFARLELIFGGDDRGHPISRTAFSRFLAREVTPRFPDGLSLFEGQGQWRDARGHRILESSRMVLIFYIPDAQSDEKIEAIRNAYKRQFHQQSVLRADNNTCISF